MSRKRNMCSTTEGVARMSVLHRRLDRIEAVVRPPHPLRSTTVLAEPAADATPEAWDAHRQNLAAAEAEYDMVVVLVPLKPLKPWASVMADPEQKEVDLVRFSAGADVMPSSLKTSRAQS